MTAAERLQAEKERLLTTTGFYVPPYRMANLMKAAAKIMDIIIKADTNICYEECRFIMAIVDAAIPRVPGACGSVPSQRAADPQNHQRHPHLTCTKASRIS